LMAPSPLRPPWGRACVRVRVRVRVGVRVGVGVRAALRQGLRGVEVAVAVEP